MESEGFQETIEPQSGAPFQLAEGVLVRPEIKPLYRFSLMIVSVAMILLPVLYLALIGSFGYAVYWYAVHFKNLLEIGGSVRTAWLVTEMAYFAPLFIGCMLFLFMIKPLFAPKPTEAAHFSLDLADAPQLFSFIGWICRSLNAPIPSRVDVDCSVNASAGFRSGFGSFFGNDIVLTIGLPLAAGLNVSQLAGVVAHEYGHFSQGVGMRASYLIRRINYWLFRVVYERDHWDLWLVEVSEDSDQSVRSALVFYLLRGAVWLGRRPAWLLFVLGHFLSSFMSRQMEFDADRYQMKMSGSDCFISTALRIQQLDLGSAIAYKQTKAKWKKERKLFDQIPDFIVSRANEISADAQARLYAQTAGTRTSYFDSHPSHTERIGRAKEAREPGILDVREPARNLFANFPELSRRASEFFYRGMIGPNFTPDWLQATERVTAPADYDYTVDRQRISAYFIGVCSNLRPVTLPESFPLVYRSQETLVAQLRSCRDKMQRASVKAASVLAMFHQADSRHVQIRQAATLIHSGFVIDPAQFNLHDGDLDAAQSRALQDLQVSDHALKEYEETVHTRLATAIQLLRLASFAATFPEARLLQEHIKNMVFVQARLASCLPELFELRLKAFALDAVIRHRLQNGPGDNLSQAFESLSGELLAEVKKIQKLTGQIRYPFDHAVEDAFVSDFAKNKEYVADPHEAALREGACHVERLLALQERILANIIEVCEKVELQASV